jgi:ankyrin repeat protein
MDPLSATASVIAVIQLTQSILLACYRLRNCDTHGDIARIIADLESLEATLDELREVCSPASDGTVDSLDGHDGEFSISGRDISIKEPVWTSPTLVGGGSSAVVGSNPPGIAADSPLNSAACAKAIENLNRLLSEIWARLKPLAQSRGLKTKLKWPFEGPLIKAKLDDIAKAKATLQLCLAAVQTRLLDKQAGILDGQTQKLDALLRDGSQKARSDAVRAFLKTSDPELNHRIAREMHEPGTSEWVWEDEAVKSWLNTPGESLWMHGIPGAGKTVLCSSIVDRLLADYNMSGDKTRGEKEGEQINQAGVKVAYFYFDFSDAKKQSVSSLLKSLIYQLLVASSSDAEIAEPASDLYDSCSGGLSEPSLESLWETLLALFRMTQRTMVVMDALDECPNHSTGSTGKDSERQRLFATLFGKDRKLNLPPNVNLLITSRNEADIAAALGPALRHTISIESAAVDADVRRHVAAALERDDKLSKWKPAVRDEIQTAIVAGARGMFRWAVCQLDMIRQCLTPAMVREELRRMPDTLDATYDRILLAVPPRHRSYVQSALRWLAFAERPLLVAELAEAAVVQPQHHHDADGGDATFDVEQSRFFSESMILELCGSLVTTSVIRHDPDSGSASWLTDKVSAEKGWERAVISCSHPTDVTSVSLSHLSVKDYLVRPPSPPAAGGQAHAQTEELASVFRMSESLAHAYLLRSCLFYLINFNGGKVAVTLDFEGWPLLEYSARRWMTHWRKSHQGHKAERHTPGLTTPFRQEAEDHRQAARRLAEQLLSPEIDEVEASQAPRVNWLNVSRPDADLEPASWPFSRYNRTMRTGASSYAQPLYWAALLGDVGLVEYTRLASAESDEKHPTNTQEGWFGSALGAAAHGGHVDVVRYLLEHGADPNALGGGEFGHVLQVAALGGSVEVVKVLLDAGAAVNAQGGRYNAAVVAAAVKEHTDVVRLLISRGADVSVGSRDYGSSLYQAAKAGDLRMVTTLLAAGAELDGLVVGAEGTPLYAAASAGMLPVVQLLLRRGADPNKGTTTRTGSGYPLCIAAEEGHVQVARALLRAGANVNIFERGARRGTPPIVCAIRSRNVDMFRLLLDAGADPESKGGSLYPSVLHDAICTGELAMARILLDRFTNICFEDSALVAAASRYGEHPWAMDSLLRRDSVNVDAWDHSDGTALQAAIKAEEEKAALILIARGARVDAVDREGSTLLLAVQSGLVAVVRELLARGADPNRSVKAETPFTASISRALLKDDGKLELADLLLKHGADVNGGNGLALYWAAQNDDDGRITHYLVEKHGAKLDLANFRHKCTPLHGALEAGNLVQVDLLLELGANLNTPPGAAGYHIHYAIESRKEEVVRHILAKGAEMKEIAAVTKKEGSSVIHQAMAKGLGSLVPLLVGRGADVKPFPPTLALLRWVENGVALYRYLRDQGSSLDPNLGNGDIFIMLVQDHAMEEVRLLLDDGMDPNCNNGLSSPIQIAVQRGHMDTLELLIENGADVNYAPGYMSSALVVACQQSNLAMAEYLIDQGADPNGVCNEVMTPLSAAVGSAGNLLLIELLLSRGAEIPFTVDAKTHGDQGWHSAAYIFERAIWGGKAVLTWLFAELEAAGVSAGRRRVFLDAALQAAAEDTKLDVVNWLMEAGADPSFRGGKHGCPLAAAARGCYGSAAANNRSQIIKHLLQRGANANPEPLSRPLPTKASAGPSDFAESPSAGASDLYPSPLLVALTNRAISAARSFLTAGANPNQPCGPFQNFATPLQAAARLDGETVRLLLDAGADANAVSPAASADMQSKMQDKDPLFGTALQVAAWAHDLESVLLLLAAGADPSVVSGRYGTALQAAAKLDTTGRGRGTYGGDGVQVMRALVEAGADPAQSGVGKYGSALQMAAKSGNLGAVRWLVEEMGVDVDVRGGRWGSVREAAVKKGRWGVVNYLEKKFGRIEWKGAYDDAMGDARWKSLVVSWEGKANE